MTVGVAGALGAIAAIIGFPGVGLGIALALIGLGAFAGFSVPFGSADLTFEDGGLRLHKGSAQCLLPWTSIKEIESIGPESFFFTKLSIADPDRVVESVVPETPQDRKRVETLVTRTGAMQGEIVLERWAAGLDGASLVRAIREGMAGRPPQMN